MLTNEVARDIEISQRPKRLTKTTQYRDMKVACDLAVSIIAAIRSHLFVRFSRVSLLLGPSSQLKGGPVRQRRLRALEGMVSRSTLHVA